MTRKLHTPKRFGPLPRQIAGELRSDIVSGVYADGNPFPSETVLTEYYGVSRVTIRSALALLQQEGLIVRRQGSGTVVRNRVHHKMMQNIMDFHREAEGLGRKPSTRVISIRFRKSRIRERILFDISGNGEVAELRRLRLLDGLPVVLQTSSHPAELLTGVAEEDLRDRSLYDFLSERKGVTVRDADHVLEPFSVGSEEASLLGIAAGTAVIRARRTTRDTEGRTIEMAENLIRGDRYKYHFRLNADGVTD